MRSKLLHSMLTILISISVLSTSPSQAGVIEESLKNRFSSRGSHNVIVQLPSVMGSVMKDPSLTLFSKDDPDPKKIDIFVELLKKSTTAAQAPFIKFLELLGLRNQVKTFWISNKIAIKNASTPLISALSLIPGGFIVREERKIRLVHINLEVEFPNQPNDPTEIQWGVKKIGAPYYWATRTRGEGVVVANLDSGANVNHEALKSNYRGGSFSWHDAVNNNNTGPYDDMGHGTHTLGTICGTTRGIGVAPGAKWIACKVVDAQGSGTESMATDCAEWIIRPNGFSIFKPNIVSNSWGAYQNDPFFDDEITAWQFAGIIPVFAIGTGGDKCQTTVSPGDRDGIISVGSTTQNDTVSTFSSRGPNAARHFRPHVTAPGDRILSAWYTGDRAYVTLSGSSQATPHVAGACALFWAGKRATSYYHLLGKLKHYAFRPVDKVTKQDIQCGTHHDHVFPNNAYGWGRIRLSTWNGL